jgi:EmrB/QacA subfamily drug resistance transporter
VPEGGRGRRLVAAVLAAALMPLNSTMIAVALPRISDELGHDPAVVTQALVTSYLVAAVVLQSPAGKVGDRLGHPRMLLIGQVVVALGALMGYVAGSLGLLVAARVLMATGGAVLVPATVALLRHELPPERRGRGFGAFGAVMALAAALGPLVGGELVHLFGWRSVFVANVPLLLLSAALAGKAPPAAAEPDRTPPPRFDWLGSGLLAVGLSAVVLGLRPDGDHAVVLLVAGVAVLVPFAVWERRASDPVVAFDLFRSAPFSAGTLLIAVQNLVMYALLFEVPLIAAALFGLDARGTGWLLVCLMLAMVITSPVAGRLVDRVGARAVALAGSGFTLVGIAVLGSTDLSTPRQVAVPLVLLGVGLGLATPAAQSASMSAAPQDRTGMAAGVGSTMRYLGGLVGVAVLSLVLDVRGSRAEVVSDHRSLMAFFGCALAVGMASSALLPGRTRSAARQGG